MVEKDFSLRLAQLRERKGVSARDMSLSMGQNPGYINNIESGKSMPSLAGIFYICDYLVHSAAPNGSWCGGQRQLSAANGSLN